jgi:hypothetical protein
LTIEREGEKQCDGVCVRQREGMGCSLKDNEVSPPPRFPSPPQYNTHNQPVIRKLIGNSVGLLEKWKEVDKITYGNKGSRV